MGCAAGDLASLAQGSIDGYIHSGIKPWDAAAAADHLGVARSLAQRMRIGHAAILRMFVDEVEAAAAAGRLDQAEQAIAAIHGPGQEKSTNH